MTKIKETIKTLLAVHEVFASAAELNITHTAQKSAYANLAEILQQSTLSPTEVRTLLETPEIQDIKSSLRICLAVAKGNAEKQWAEEILALSHEQRADAINNFWQMPAYHKLVNGEYARWEEAQLLTHNKGELRPIHFIGSGPLPLTAIAFNSLAVPHALTLIDNDPNAHKLGKQIIDTINTQHIKSIQADGAQFDYPQASIIMVAGLVPDKNSILGHITTTAPSAIAAFRSVTGLNELLHEPLDINYAASLGWKPVQSPPQGNSVFTVTLLHESNPLKPASAPSLDVQSTSGFVYWRQQRTL